MTYLMACDEVVGTQQVEASSPAEALAVAKQYLGAYDWQIHGTVEPVPMQAPMTYQAPGRDPLDTEG